MVNALRIHAADNVAVALHDLAAGVPLSFADHAVDAAICTREPIPFGHKVALVFIPVGDQVIKYGAPIGLTTTDIAPGQHVHVHNLQSVRGSAQ